MLHKIDFLVCTVCMHTKQKHNSARSTGSYKHTGCDSFYSDPVIRPTNAGYTLHVLLRVFTD